MGNEITNPNGAYGYTDLQTKLGSVTIQAKTTAAITAPAVVSFGTEGKVTTAATNATASLCLGIVCEDAASGDTVPVVIMGIAENVPATGAVSAGDLLKRSATTAGSVAATATPAAGEVIGVALAASASNVVDVWVVPAKALS